MATLQPRTFAEVLALAEGIASAQIRVGVHPAAAIRLGLIDSLMLTAGLQPPAILSGQRSCQRQAELKLLGRPAAAQSWHVPGLAFDLDYTSPNYDTFTQLWKLFGGRDGRDFSVPDQGHVDLPIGGLEPAPCF